MNTSDALVEGDRTRLCPIMMIQMIVEEGEEQMHISMGKRMSNCEPDAPMPQNTMDGSMMPMMMNSNIIGGVSITMMGMMRFGRIFTILFGVLVVLSIVALVKWLQNSNQQESKVRSALDILKERFAKGEIDK